MGAKFTGGNPERLMVLAMASRAKGNKILGQVTPMMGAKSASGMLFKTNKPDCVTSHKNKVLSSGKRAVTVTLSEHS